ncbi:MAG: extracellular solute-binding protein, partial [Parasporobacterium sp.]|nr:extracellular solute-binding protein [Parasporobacterium sp.]
MAKTARFLLVQILFLFLETTAAFCADDFIIEPTDVVFWFAMEREQEAVLSELTERFNNENSFGINVRLVNYGDFGELYEGLERAFRPDEAGEPGSAGTGGDIILDDKSGDPEAENKAVDLFGSVWAEEGTSFEPLPDLVQFQSLWNASFKEWLVPLDDFVQADFEDYAGLVEGFKEECELPGYISALPFSKSVYVYFYDAGLYEDLGLDVPKTWDDMLYTGRVFMEKMGIPAFGIADPAGFLESSLAQNDC